MRKLLMCATLAFGVTHFAAHGQACKSGERQLNSGEPCIPAGLFNYLYCLKQSGGGKIEVQKKSDDSTSKQLEIAVGGKGSGVVLSGELSGGFKKAETQRAARELSEKLDPTLAARCQSIAEQISGGQPPDEPGMADLKGLFGVNVRVGLSRDDLKQSIPDASWNTNSKGKLFAAVRGILLGIPGDIRFWLESDKVKSVSFETSVSGASWVNYRDTSSGREQTTSGTNGERLNFAQAKQQCDPVLGAKSLLLREFGAATRIVVPETEYDPTVAETRPKTVRLARGVKWKNEYRHKNTTVTAEYDWFAWDIDIQNTSTSTTSKKNFYCTLRVDFA